MSTTKKRFIAVVCLASIFIGFCAGIRAPFIHSFCGISTKTVARYNVSHIHEAIRDYYTEYGVQLDSHSATIRVLLGENPRKIKFLELLPNTPQDAEGRFLDPWGSPYRIGVSDPKNPRVWSPGKNKKDEPDDPHSDDICSWR